MSHLVLALIDASVTPVVGIALLFFGIALVSSLVFRWYPYSRELPSTKGDVTLVYDHRCSPLLAQLVLEIKV